MQANQKKAWDELVEQVRKGARAEEVLGLRDQLQNLSPEELWQRLEVHGLVDTPLSFQVPSPEDLLEFIVPPPPEEDYVVLPPCVCLDSVLHPEFAMPPEELLVECEREKIEEEEVKEEVKNRKRPLSPEPPPHSHDVIGIEDDVIDLTQD